MKSSVLIPRRNRITIFRVTSVVLRKIRLNPSLPLNNFPGHVDDTRKIVVLKVVLLLGSCTVRA